MALSSQRRCLGAVAALIAGVLLAGCGSGGQDTKPAAAAAGADAKVWTGTLCSGISEVIGGLAAFAKTPDSPQGRKDGLLAFSENAQRAFASTARKLQQLGPPRVSDGKRIQDTAVNVFTTAAGTVGEQRAKLAALDANDPDFVQKATHLPGPDLGDLGAVSAQMQQLTANKELAPAFEAAPECQRLGAAAGPR